jgi:glycosyltransferase involved in cell wall biosynthesis
MSQVLETSTLDVASTSRPSSLHPSIGRMPSISILSTFPPTHCGLATFAAALAEGLKRVGVRHIGIVEATDGSQCSLDPRVHARLVPGNAQSRIAAARVINSHDFLLLQHEFGIFGGDDGREVLDLLDDVYIPVIVTLHTVPLVPTRSQREVLEAIAARADVLVTMTQTAKDRLLSLYDVRPSSVVTIPHGATVPTGFDLPATDEVTLLTWGLLGPGKGVEWVIDALAMVPDLHSRVNYVVAGQTHPKVIANHGERYRNMLKMRAERLGVRDLITFDDQYRTLPSLMSLIQESTCVVLPYDSQDQITSGVLVDAVSARRPVIATAFPHAQELVTPEIGIVVPHQDPVSMASAIRAVAMNPHLVESMALATEPIAREHRWASVAARYADVCGQISRVTEAIR